MSDGPSIKTSINRNVEPNIEISVESELWSSLGDIDELVTRAITESIRRSRVRLKPSAEISLLLCDDRRIRALNMEWRGHDAPTNVLSFPAPGEVEAAHTLGDIAVAFETTAREAKEEGKTFKDHFTHLLVHGFLHLVGFDHQNETEAEAMERIERDILGALGIDDPYHSILVGIAE